VAGLIGQVDALVAQFFGRYHDVNIAPCIVPLRHGALRVSLEWLNISRKTVALCNDVALFDRKTFRALIEPSSVDHCPLRT
jgi:hypothetical protein